ncbi:MAG: ribosomal protein [Candidatus Taylorbacteria bacterium]|nr:ribosomal protein [Candidatus Taylorbacteria bacterium]
MRHHSSIRKFGREKDQRNALMKSLARNLVLHEQIITTLPKAKSLRPIIEKLITKAKTGTLASRRLVNARIGGEKETKILFDTIAPKYATRNGGYTRIVKLPRRQLDAAPMAVIQFV